ncbi:HD domain-containing protein [Actinospongicola halichondriae]|uniref:HD domain-containing protein n=1 Tax=Actinospongicola halichondriae TaxID=3236844 RepID=UPI003D595148
MTHGPVDELLALYRSPPAAAPYDERVTECDHALQCADRAIEAGAPDMLVVAALFHDIGHLVPGGAALETTPAATGAVNLPEVDDRHERAGSRLLRRWFTADVTAPVALHVEAKRYLCGVDEGYASSLSSSSVHTLALQGGAMTGDEVAAFRRRRGWADAVELRRWDDAAKVAGAATRTLDDHRDRIAAVLAG